MAGSRRFREQKWLLDAVIQTVGLEWDLRRMAVVTAPAGFEAIGDWYVIARSVKRYDEVTPIFYDSAALREKRAREAEAQGNHVSAQESYLIASLYYSIAQWPIDELSEQNFHINKKKIDCYQKYADLSTHHKIERVEIPLNGKKMGAWLHLPPNAKPPYPIIIMLPGMDTCKEMLVWSYGDKILERGFAALAIEGPGQYETLLNGINVTADNFGEAGVEIVKWIDSRKDVDRDRIGLFGRSFGSYAGTVMANSIADRLLGACVGLPCHEPGFQTIFESASPTFKNRFMFMAGYEDETKFDEFMKGFDIARKVSKLTCPVMVLGGELDELSPIKSTYAMARNVPGPVELVIYQNERHAPGLMPAGQLGPHFYTMMADWLTARVRDRKPMKESRFRYVKSNGELEERPMP